METQKTTLSGHRDRLDRLYMDRARQEKRIEAIKNELEALGSTDSTGLDHHKKALRYTLGAIFHAETII